MDRFYPHLTYPDPAQLRELGWRSFHGWVATHPELDFNELCPHVLELLRAHLNQPKSETTARRIDGKLRRLLYALAARGTIANVCVEFALWEPTHGSDSLAVLARDIP